MADLDDSTFGQHLEAIKAEMTANPLELIGSNIAIRKFPWLLAADVKPIAILCHLPERRLREGMIGLSDFRLRVLVALIISSNRDLTSNLGTELKWRQTLFTSFDKSTRLRAYGVVGLMESIIEPGVPADAQQFVKANYDAQYMMIQSRVRLAPAVI